MSLLLRLLRAPASIERLALSDWDLLMREIRSQRLSARVSWLIEDHGLIDHCPPRAWRELAAQRFYPQFIQARTRLELRKLRKALADVDTPIMALKGAAYLLAELPLARGRVFADLDILIPRDRLADVERTLRAAGWEGSTPNAYDQEYYRRWMHEIPPLRHPERGVELDVHHGILPLSSRLHPDPTLIWQQAGQGVIPPFLIPSPPDMLLHSTAHGFQDSEIDGNLRDLLDIHDMASDFGRDPHFWDRLLERAGQLELTRPLSYALNTAHTLLDTPIPQPILRTLDREVPGRLGKALVNGLLQRALTPAYPYRRPPRLSLGLLYLRSHWLRMPPGLLAAHLGRKTLRRLAPRSQRSA